uniref:Uncharacterized protein n=1 Tax=Anguilla anguilla TaxID=7936 RepID=A0A0E9VDU0_ANGAN
MIEHSPPGATGKNNK